MAVLVALTLTLTVAVAVVGCAKTDEVAAGRSTERRVAYVTSKVMPAGQHRAGRGGRRVDHGDRGAR